MTKAQRPYLRLNCFLVGFLLTAVACGTDTASPTQGASPDVSAFVGQWYQHAGNLSISPNGNVDMMYQVQAPPAPAEFPELKLRIESVDGDKAAAIVVSSDDPQASKGSKFVLWKTEPGIVVTTPTGGSSEWCDLKHADDGDCGA